MMITSQYDRVRVLSVSMLVVIVFVIMVGGCDRTRTVEQTVVLRLSAVEDNERLCKNAVSIREYAEPTQVDLRREHSNPGRFDRMYPWTKIVTTNQSNTANLAVR